MTTGPSLIGKEADHWEEDYYLGIRNGDIDIAYGGDPATGAQAFAQLKSAVAAFGKFAVHKATGISRATIAKLERGDNAATGIPHWKIIEGLDRLNLGRSAKRKAEDAERARLIAIRLQAGGVRAGARIACMDPSNFAKKTKPFVALEIR